MTYTCSDSFIDKHRDINIHDDWYDGVFEDFKMICKILGIDLNEQEPSFSGFCSQGDGASWTGQYRAIGGWLSAPANVTYDLAPAEIREHAPQDEELHRIADELCLLARIYGPVYAVVRRHGNHYVHSSAMRLDEWSYYDEQIDMDDVAEEIIDLIETTLKDLFRALADWLYKSLEESYDHLTSDDVVKESLEANEIYEEEDAQ
jgi:hypothetical protein